MEEKNDKHLDTTKENEEHQERDKNADEQTKEQNENSSHQDVAGSQDSNSGENKEVKKFSKKKITLAYWIMIVFVIVACGCVIYTLLSNSHSCLADPIKYYSDKMMQKCFCLTP